MSGKAAPPPDLDDTACAAFSRAITDRRVLLRLLRRAGAQRVAAARAIAQTCGAEDLLSDAVLHGLMARRPIIGLLRRNRGRAEAIVRETVRRSMPQRVRFRIRTAGLDATRENIVVVVHETSRTGAPILGWNIARALAQRYNVFTIMLAGGALTGAFAEISAATLGPDEPHRLDEADYAFALQDILRRHPIKYAIVNSCESRALVAPCRMRLIPTVLLMHEFGSTVYARDALRCAFDMASEIIFPAEIVARSSLELHPPLLGRPIRILPQGMSALPDAAASSPDAPPPALRQLADARQAGAFIVLGAGSVQFRKGVDLFLAVAMSVCREISECPVHFVWIGHGYKPTEDMTYSIFLQEQIARSGLRGCLTFVDEVADLEPAYALADTFLLSSRLDPLPNVSIDAAYRGIPVVCFGGASGMADILLSDPTTSGGVVGYLDTAAAAQAIIALIRDQGLRQRTAAAIRALARGTFDMAAYCNAVDALGCAASTRNRLAADPAEHAA